MHDGIRRLGVLFLVIILALLLVYVVRGHREGYGLFDLLRGERAPHVEGRPEAYTPAETSPIALNDVPLLAKLSDEYAQLAEAVVQSVVSIDTSTLVDIPQVSSDPFERLLGLGGGYRRAERPGLGSGVIISKEGHVVTNYHVIAKVDQIAVTTNEGEKFRAQVIGADEISDVAVLRIISDQKREFHALKFADSTKVRQGDLVFAVGNPFGLRDTITQGIISSATPRRFSDSSPALFQTNTVINPGNSGGPLVNIQGDIVGINVAIYKGQQEVQVWQGYGLAIPSNDAREAAEAILNKGVPIRGYLGVYPQNLTPYVARQLGLKSTRGAYISGAEPGSPADEAGLQMHDVIVEYGGQRVVDTNDLVRRIQETPVGTSVEIGVVRQGQYETLKAVIREKESELDDDPPTPNQDLTEQVWAKVGIRVRDLLSQEKNQLGLNPADPVVLITEVNPDAQSAVVLKAGYFIHALDQQLIKNADFFYKTLANSRQDRVLVSFSTPEGRFSQFNLSLR